MSARRVAWLLLLARCTTETPATGCQTNADCGGGLRCAAGVCAAPEVLPTRCVSPSPRGPVRVFAVGAGVSLDDLATLDGYARSVRARLDRDVAPNLARDRPNLLVFPDVVGRLAALVGPRGDEARRATSLARALAALETSYPDAVRWYQDRATTAIPSGRLALLAATDTVWTVLDAVYADAARRLRAWVVVTADVALAERSDDPATVRALGDPATSSPTAWVARSDEVSHQTLYFAPDGTLAATQREAYLDPVETDTLGLSPARPAEARGVALPFGVVASVTSHDAAAPDLFDRLERDDVSLVLLPTAWPSYAAFDERGAWGPDTLKSAGWSELARRGGFVAGAQACASGNLFGEALDCQSAVFARADRAAPRDQFIGQAPDTGFAAVASWAAADDVTVALDARRRALAAVGAALAPGGAREGQYAVGTVWRDVDLGSTPPPSAARASSTARARSVAVAPSLRGEQRRPDVTALANGATVAVWEDTRDGCSALYAARTLATPGAAFLPATALPHGRDPRGPRLASRGNDLVALVWQERTESAGARHDVVRFARSLNGGRSFDAPVTLEPRLDADQWAPDVAIDPSTGTIHVAWVDTRDGPMRVRVASSRDVGMRFDASRPLDALPAMTAYTPRSNQWAPSIDARGGVVAVAWTDLRHGAWEVYGNASRDDGRAWATAFHLDDADASLARTHADPAVAVAPDGAWRVAWTDLRTTDGDYDARVTTVRNGAPGASASLAATDAAHRPQWRPAAGFVDDALVAVWQDLRGPHNHLWSATQSPDGTVSPDARLDDGADDTQQLAVRVATFAPTVGAAPRRVAVFEDDRDGARRVRAVTW